MNTFEKRVKTLKGVEARIRGLVLDIEKLDDPYIVSFESSHINRLIRKVSFDIVDIAWENMKRG